MFKMIAIPLGYLMQLCYKVIKDYGLALLAFTFLIKVILLPLQIKQQKSTVKMQKYQPQIEKIKKKYGNDQQKYQQKMTEFYAKEGISPAGSCLPMLVSMLVLFSLIYVVYQPLYYVLNDVKDISIKESSTLVSNLYTVCYDIKDNDIDFNSLVAIYDADSSGDLSDEEIETLVSDLGENSVKNADGEELSFKATAKIKTADLGDKDLSKEKQIKAVINALLMCNDKDISLYEYMIDDSKVSRQLQSRPELIIINIIKEGYTEPFDNIDKSLVTGVNDFNYTLLGFGLGVYPSTKSITILIPIISFISQLAVTAVSQYYQKKNNPAAQLGGAMKATFYIMPIFSLIIAFNFPAGLGIYWIYSGVLSLVQIVVLNMIYTPERMDKIVEKEMSEKKKKRKTMMQKMLEIQEQSGVNTEYAKRMGLGNDDEDEDEEEEEKPDKSKMSKAELKELQRKKLNEARKRMAEKYGDEYYED